MLQVLPLESTLVRWCLPLALSLALGGSLSAQGIGSTPDVAQAHPLPDGTQVWSFGSPYSATASEVLAGGVFRLRYTPAAWTRQGYDANGILSFGSTFTDSEAWVLMEQNHLTPKDLKGHFLLFADRLLARARLVTEDRRFVNGLEVQALQFSGLVDDKPHVGFVYLASQKAHTVTLLVVVPSDDALAMEGIALLFLNGLCLVTP